MQVVVNLDRTAADLLTEFSSGALIYLYSAATEGGSYSLVGSGTALVSGTERYEIYDTAGTPGTTWYKFRVGNSGGTLFTDYSTAWLSTSKVAYATLDDLLETGDWPGESRHNYLTDLLVRGAAYIDSITGRRFYRSPQVTGTETFYLDVVRSGMRSLSLATLGVGCTDGAALDLVSVTSLYTRTSESASYVEITAGDTGYYLLSGPGHGAAGTVWPYEDVALSPIASTTTWPLGYRAVKIIGVRGFATVPEFVRAANVDLAREWYRQGPGGGPAQQGVNQFGTPIFLTGAPQSVRALQSPPWRKRSWASI